MNDKVSASSKVAFDLGQIAAVIGAFSAISVFIAADSAFSFARGLMTSIGFPPQIMTFRTSFDFFPTIGHQETLVFTLNLGLGFFWSNQVKSSDRRAARVVLASGLFLAAIAIIGYSWPSHWGIFSTFLTYGSYFAPLLVGFSYRSLSTERPNRITIIGLVVFFVFFVHSSALFDLGYQTGQKVSTRIAPEFPGLEKGFAVVKMKDFPIVNLESKGPLNLSTAGSKAQDNYFYSSSRNCFLRLVAYDDSNYYLIENHGGTVQPLAIRKDIVLQMIFLSSL